MASSTCFEPEGLFSGRRLCVEIRYSRLYILQMKFSREKKLLMVMHKKQILPYCTYNRLPRAESLVSKHIEEVINLNINLEKVHFFVYIVLLVKH
jgi:hypothetical protein